MASPTFFIFIRFRLIIVLVRADVAVTLIVVADLLLQYLKALCLCDLLYLPLLLFFSILQIFI